VSCTYTQSPLTLTGSTALWRAALEVR